MIDFIAANVEAFCIVSTLAVVAVALFIYDCMTKGGPK